MYVRRSSQSTVKSQSFGERVPIGSVSGAGGGRVVGGLGAVTDRVGEIVTNMVVDVPEVAEVDAVVEDAHGLGA